MPDPMWRRIAEDLRLKIESGELGSDGKALPSELELRDLYDASRNTVRDAVKWLITRGLVETKPGQGTFVVKTIDPFVTPLSTEIEAVPGGEGAAYGSEVGESAAFASEVKARSRTPNVSEPRVEIQQAKGLIADELRLAESTTVVSRHQERFIDDTPWSLQTTFYPMRLVQQGATSLIQAETILPGAVVYIEDALLIKRAGRRDRFIVRSPDRREIEFFALPDDGRVAVFEIIQTVYDDSGKPFVVTITTYPADRNQFVMTTGKVPEEVPTQQPRPTQRQAPEK
jgi:GntR family transcriptional regulator